MEQQSIQQNRFFSISTQFAPAGVSDDNKKVVNALADVDEQESKGKDTFRTRERERGDAADKKRILFVGKKVTWIRCESAH